MSESTANEPLVVSIDGTIGGGKSVLVADFHDYIKNNKIPGFCFLDEPVDEWNTIRDKHGVPILERYYEDQPRYAFSFQMMAYISRLSLLRDALKNKENKVIITERSILTDKNVFAKMLYDDEKIEEIEYQIYLKWFDEFIRDIPNISYVYLKTDAAVAKMRVDKRARAGENIPLEYLEKCCTYHDNWLYHLKRGKLLQIDGNVDINENPEVRKERAKLIYSFTQ